MSGERELVPQHIVDRANEDIVGVIKGYLPDLKKAGKNWSAVCPFHKEKSGSFTANDAKGMYYCFGCGAGGDAIKFVMEMNPGISFRDGVRSILGELTLESASVAPRPKVEKAIECYLKCHAEDRDKSAKIISNSLKIENHTYLMRNNTAPNTECTVNGKGILLVPMINNIGETVNVAAVLTSGAINYAAGNPSYGSAAVLEPVSADQYDGRIIICVDYAHAWRIWWSQKGQSKVLACMDADNFHWMLKNCRDRFTHVGCDPSEADEHAEMGRAFVALPIDPYARLDRSSSAA